MPATGYLEVFETRAVLRLDIDGKSCGLYPIDEPSLGMALDEASSYGYKFITLKKGNTTEQISNMINELIKLSACDLCPLQDECDDPSRLCYHKTRFHAKIWLEHRKRNG